MAGIWEAGSNIVFRALFVDSTNKDGKTGLTVVVDVIGPNGDVIAAATNAATTESDATNAPGLYEYTLGSGETAAAGLYTAVFSTASSTVVEKTLMDQAVVTPQLAVVDSIDTAVGLFPQALNDVRHYTPIGDIGTSTISSTAVTLTKPRRANGILVTAVAQNIRYTVDGTAPTTTLGFLLSTSATAPTFIPVGRNTRLKFIRATGSDGTLNYQWINVKPR